MAVLRRRNVLFALATVLVALGLSALVVRGFARTKAAADGPIVSDFALLDQRGAWQQLSQYATARAVVLYAHDSACGPGDEVLAALAQARRELAGRNVVILAIDASPRRDGASANVDVPVLRDDGRIVTESLHVARSGEMVVLDPKSWRALHRGPVDPTAGAQRGRAFVETVMAVLGHRPIPATAAGARAAGCAASRDAGAAAPAAAVSYAHDVVPILQSRCVACHRQGGIAPWSMDGHERVKAWAPRMRTALLTGRMPPWHADPDFGTFAHDRSLGADQKRALLRWIDAGAPRGTGVDPLTASPPPPAEEWPLGKPDVVLELPLQEIPATGTVDYRNIPLPAPVTRDSWVRAIHLAPQNPSVMHHAAVFVEYPTVWQHQQPHWHDGAGGFFGAYAPGLQPQSFPPDSGAFLPVGATLMFQLHYTTNGRATTDRPRLALYFHSRPPALEARVIAAVNMQFVIPRNAPDHPVESTYVFDKAVTLHGLLPHMHHRGKRFRFEVESVDGRREVLLSVPRYDFNWQTFYMLQEPRPIAAGTKIHLSGAFDNSSSNPVNPDPSQEVRWGPQSWDEMFIGYMMYTAPRQPVPLKTAQSTPAPAPAPRRTARGG
jgi:hypothetical protein